MFENHCIKDIQYYNLQTWIDAECNPALGSLSSRMLVCEHGNGENKSNTVYATVNIYLTTCNAFISHYKNSYVQVYHLEFTQVFSMWTVITFLKNSILFFCFLT